jgi:hypothetical protein
MPEDNSGTGATLTDTQVAARTNLTALKIRDARGERIAQSAIAEAADRTGFNACSSLPAPSTASKPASRGAARGR